MGSTAVNLIKGEDGAINLYFIYRISKRPFSLAGATEIEVRLPAEEGNSIVKKLTLDEVEIVGVPELGHVIVPLSDADTDLLKKADNQAVFAQVDIGTTRKKFNKAAILNVTEDSVLENE